MAKKEWLDWFKCNLLEIIILLMVLVLLVKVFGAPAADLKVEGTAVQKELPLKNPLTGKATEEVGETSIESGEQPSEEEATPEQVAEEAPAEALVEGAEEQLLEEKPVAKETPTEETLTE